jgi:surface antigen
MVAAFAMLAGCETVPTVGERLDNADLSLIATATQQALEQNKVGVSANWTNPANGHRGTVMPTRTFAAAGGVPCRNFQQMATVAGQTIRAFDTACRDPAGTWASTGYGSLTDAIRTGSTDYASMGPAYGYYGGPWCGWSWRDPYCYPYYGPSFAFGLGLGFHHHRHHHFHHGFHHSRHH